MRELIKYQTIATYQTTKALNNYQTTTNGQTTRKLDKDQTPTNDQINREPRNIKQRQTTKENK